MSVIKYKKIIIPMLPDFALAQKPDEYQLPSVDASWSEDNLRTKNTSNHIKCNQRQSSA